MEEIRRIPCSVKLVLPIRQFKKLNNYILEAALNSSGAFPSHVYECYARGIARNYGCLNLDEVRHVELHWYCEGLYWHCINGDELPKLIWSFLKTRKKKDFYIFLISGDGNLCQDYGEYGLIRGKISSRVSAALHCRIDKSRVRYCGQYFTPDPFDERVDVHS